MLCVSNPELFKSRLGKYQTNIGSALINSENVTMEQFKHCEGMNHWISVLATQKEAFMKTEEEDEQIGHFILSFTDNITNLKDMEEELTIFLRNEIENRETPETIRLNRLLRQTMKELEVRQSMLAQVEENAEEAVRMERDMLAENTTLSEESEKSEAMLAKFSTKNSYEIVQKAKKYKLVEEEWEERKAKLKTEIAEAEEELQMYHDHERMLVQLTKQANQQEDLEARQRLRLAEQLRVLEAEAGLSQENHETAVNNMRKDFLSLRSSLLAKEKKQTTGDTKRLQIAGERLLQKYKKKRAAMNRDADKAMKKAGESADQRMVPIEEAQAKDNEYMEKFMEEHIKELETSLEEYNKRVELEIENEMRQIEEKNRREMELMKASKARNQLRLSERDIEIIGLTKKLTSLEGVVGDVQLECRNAEVRHEILTARLEQSTQTAGGEIQKVRNETDDIIKFITKAGDIVSKLTEHLEKMMNAKSNNMIPIQPRKTASALDHVEPLVPGKVPPAIIREIPEKIVVPVVEEVPQTENQTPETNPEETTQIELSESTKLPEVEQKPISAVSDQQSVNDTVTENLETANEEEETDTKENVLEIAQDEPSVVKTQFEVLEEHTVVKTPLDEETQKEAHRKEERDELRKTESNQKVTPEERERQTRALKEQLHKFEEDEQQRKSREAERIQKRDKKESKKQQRRIESKREIESESEATVTVTCPEETETEIVESPVQETQIIVEEPLLQSSPEPEAESKDTSSLPILLPEPPSTNKDPFETPRRSWKRPPKPVKEDPPLPVAVSRSIEPEPVPSIEPEPEISQAPSEESAFELEVEPEIEIEIEEPPRRATERVVVQCPVDITDDTGQLSGRVSNRSRRSRDDPNDNDDVLMRVEGLATYSDDDDHMIYTLRNRAKSERRVVRQDEDDAYVYNLIQRNMGNGRGHMVTPKRSCQSARRVEPRDYSDDGKHIIEGLNDLPTPKTYVEVRRVSSRRSNAAGMELPTLPVTPKQSATVTLRRPSGQRLTSKRGFLSENQNGGKQKREEETHKRKMLCGSLRFKARRNGRVLDVKSSRVKK